jgi:hypothetical protein
MSKYAFEGETVKIIHAHFEKMQKLYQNINLMAELEQLDLELHGVKKYWMPLNAKLNYRNKNAPPRQVAHHSGNVAHLNRSTRETTLEQELGDRSWAQ